MRSLFRSLYEKFKPTDQPFYRLSDRDYKLLSSLLKSDEWKAYLTLLDRHGQSLGEQLLYAPASEVMERRGVIKGFMEAPTFVVNLLKNKELDDANRRRQSELERHRTANLGSSAHHTPFSASD